MAKGGKREGAGRKPGSVDPRKKEIIEIFKAAAPGLVELAIKKSTGYTEIINGKETYIPGDNNLLKELIKKALPDNINIGLDGQTVKDFISGLLSHRPMGAKLE